MGNILVADDDPDHLEILAMVLGFDGHEVATAGDGGAALAMLQAGNRFDVVVVDLNMPVASGLDIVAHLRREDALATTKVITMSADPGERETSLAAGADAFLAKPFEMRTLRAMVRSDARPD